MIYQRRRLEAGKNHPEKGRQLPRYPNFLFSEQKLKILPQRGACAMFFREDNNPPLLQDHSEPGSHQVIARHDFKSR
jgi:hypothetical protein